MFAVSEVLPNGQQNGQSQSQQQVIASVVALQRVIAGQSGAESGDASSRNFSAEKGKVPRVPERAAVKADAEAPSERPENSELKTSAEAKSIVEAQEASTTDTTIVAAFQARHGLTDLLSVIRDPEDRMLPTSPES